MRTKMGRFSITVTAALASLSAIWRTVRRTVTTMRGVSTHTRRGQVMSV